MEIKQLEWKKERGPDRTLYRATALDGFITYLISVLDGDQNDCCWYINQYYMDKVRTLSVAQQAAQIHFQQLIKTEIE